MACDIRIGTSGWSYASWKGGFYPADLPAAGWLPHYARTFDAVELNASFYRLPTEAALAAWRDRTPPGFTFAAKGSRFLTHVKRLQLPEQGGIGTFMDRIQVLGPKLGPILFQLPPRFLPDVERLERFLEALPAGHRYAFELRDLRWHVPEVLRALERHGAAAVAWDLKAVQSPVELTADWAYVRLHGPNPRPYVGSYPPATLEAWADRIRAWKRHLKAVHVYFDNTDGPGCAIPDALALKRLLGLPVPAAGDPEWRAASPEGR